MGGSKVGCFWPFFYPRVRYLILLFTRPQSPLAPAPPAEIEGLDMCYLDVEECMMKMAESSDEEAFDTAPIDEEQDYGSLTAKGTQKASTAAAGSAKGASKGAPKKKGGKKRRGSTGTALEEEGDATNHPADMGWEAVDEVDEAQ